MKHMFIYGVPGVGKSTVASELANEFGVEYVELDKVRPQAQQEVSRNEEPFIYEYTTEAWKRFGELNQKTAVQGFLAVRQAFTRHIQADLESHSGGFVAEAVFVDPHTFMKSGLCVLITAPDQDFHYSHFFVHRPRTEEENTQFKAARYIQEYLINEAQDLRVPVISNQTEIAKVTSQIKASL